MIKRKTWDAHVVLRLVAMMLWPVDSYLFVYTMELIHFRRWIIFFVAFLKETSNFHTPASCVFTRYSCNIYNKSINSKKSSEISHENIKIRMRLQEIFQPLWYPQKTSFYLHFIGMCDDDGRTKTTYSCPLWHSVQFLF